MRSFNFNILLLFFTCFLWSNLSLAVESEKSREGTTILLTPEEIADLKVWVENAREDLSLLQDDTRRGTLELRRSKIVREFEAIVGRSSRKENELLTRFTLNRALEIDEMVGQSPAPSELQSLVSFLDSTIELAKSFYTDDQKYLEAIGRQQKPELQIPMSVFALQYAEMILRFSRTFIRPELEYQVTFAALGWLAHDLNSERNLSRLQFSESITRVARLQGKYPQMPTGDDQSVLIEIREFKWEYRERVLMHISSVNAEIQAEIEALKKKKAEEERLARLSEEARLREIAEKERLARLSEEERLAHIQKQEAERALQEQLAAAESARDRLAILLLGRPISKPVEDWYSDPLELCSTMIAISTSSANTCIALLSGEKLDARVVDALKTMVSYSVSSALNAISAVKNKIVQRDIAKALISMTKISASTAARFAEIAGNHSYQSEAVDACSFMIAYGVSEALDCFTSARDGVFDPNALPIVRDITRYSVSSAATTMRALKNKTISANILRNCQAMVAYSASNAVACVQSGVRNVE